MSLLSKLLNGKKPTLDDVVDLFKEKDAPAAKPAAQPAKPACSPRPEPLDQQSLGEETPIGRSWGERMPNEPNQYNFPGSYLEYFQDIFSHEFAAYRVARTRNPLSDKTMVFNFYDGFRPVLVVEVMSRRADLQKLRRDCARSGIPYLRFYYDYHGWWNARSYVVNRINAALGR
jgi:hypothetical protein